MENAPVPLKLYARTPAADETALDPNTSYAKILQFISGTPKVVDFGCGPGNLSGFLARRHCDVVGVDINKEHVTSAREYCSDVLVADIESVPLLTLFPNARFDVAIFADILEHLRDPGRLLADVPRILRTGGYVIASIPNIAHGAVRLAMLRGQFNYQELGILDETHLRFFTRQTVEEMFERSGFYIEAIERTFAPVIEPSGTLVPGLSRDNFPEDLVRLVESEPEATTLQFIVKAVPGPAPEAYYHAAKQKNAELQTRVSDLERKLRTTATGELENAQRSVPAETQERAHEPEPDLPTRAHYEDTLGRLHEATWRANELQAELEKLNRQSDELRAANEGLVLAGEAQAASEVQLGLANARTASLQTEIAALHNSKGELLERLAASEQRLEIAMARASTAEAEAVTLAQEIEQLRIAGEMLSKELAGRLWASEAHAEELRASLTTLEGLQDATAIERDLLKDATEELEQRLRQNEEASERRILKEREHIERIGVELTTALEIAADAQAKAMRLEVNAAAGKQLVEEMLLELAENKTRISEDAQHARRLEDEIVKGNRVIEASNIELEIRKAALSDKLAMLESSDRLARGLNTEVQRLAERERELEEAQRGLLAEAQRLRISEEDLRARVSDGEQLLLERTEELVASLQAESAELATLVDTVQSSHFWKIKRWLRRFRASIFGS